MECKGPVEHLYIVGVLRGDEREETEDFWRNNVWKLTKFDEMHKYKHSRSSRNS